MFEGPFRVKVRRMGEGEPLEERCHVLCARLGRRATLREAELIGAVLEQADADGWWFLSPGTAIAVFVSRKQGYERTVDCEAALSSLAARDASISVLEIAVAEGPVTATFTAAGLIRSMPVGEVVAEAVRRTMAIGRT